MDGGHITLFNLSELVEGICHRCKAVGGAACSGYNRIGCLQGLLVYAEYNGGKVVACGSRDNALLCACGDVSGSLFLGGIEARAFKDYVYIERLPGKVDSIFFSVDFDGFAVYGDGIFACGYAVGILISALSGIVLQKVSEHLGAGEVVDSDDFVALCIEHLPESKATDTTEAVDCNFYVCHSFVFLRF